MAIFVQNENVESNQSFGQIINKVRSEFIEPELKYRKIDDFKTAGVEFFSNGKHKVYLDDEVQIEIEFKKEKLKPSDTGKLITLDLKEIKNFVWSDAKLNKDSAKILVVHFNSNWWIYYADFRKQKELEEKFKVTQTFKIRGGGYLPLKIREEEENEFVEGYRAGLETELPKMWKRYITISQKYRGVMAYDGNYFDLFSHAQELYILGFYYSSIIVCRTAAEQALVSILIKSGKIMDIYKQERKKKKKKKLKSIEQLVGTCRSHSLFGKKYLINKTAAKNLNDISIIASNLVHPKHDLSEMEFYKKQAIKCMDNLQYVIKKYLNFVKDTGVVSGYKITSSVKRLK